MVDDNQGDEHGTKDMDSILEELDDGGWGETEEQAFGDVPDDLYICKINKAAIAPSKNSGRLQVGWDLIIISGETTGDQFKGRHIFKYDGIDNPDSRGWFRSGLTRLGVDWPASAKELPNTLETLLDTHCEVRAKTKEGNDRQNYYFNRAVDDAEVPQDVEEPAVETPAPKPKAAAPKPVPKPVAKPAAAPAAKPAPKPKPAPAPAPEPEADEGEPDDVPADDDTAPSDDPSVNLNFEGEIDLAIRKRIVAAGVSQGFDPKDYDSRADLLCDVAEHVGISGDYEDPETLTAEVEAAIAAAG